MTRQEDQVTATHGNVKVPLALLWHSGHYSRLSRYVHALCSILCEPLYVTVT